jgi:NADH:ubiquinone oxidoreductase subunit F (NADH-binding)
MTRKFVTVEACDKCRRVCRKEVADTMEKDLERLPSNDALASLATQLEGLRGDVKAQGAELRGLAEVLERVERPLNLLMEHHLRDTRGGRG